MSPASVQSVYANKVQNLKTPEQLNDSPSPSSLKALGRRVSWVEDDYEYFRRRVGDTRVSHWEKEIISECLKEQVRTLQIMLDFEAEKIEKENLLVVGAKSTHFEQEIQKARVILFDGQALRIDELEQKVHVLSNSYQHIPEYEPDYDLQYSNAPETEARTISQFSRLISIDTPEQETFRTFQSKDNTDINNEVLQLKQAYMQAVEELLEYKVQFERLGEFPGGFFRFNELNEEVDTLERQYIDAREVQDGVSAKESKEAAEAFANFSYYGPY